MGVFSKRKQRSQGGKIYKIINNVSIVGLFLAVTLFVLMIMGTIGWSSAMVGFVLAIAILCFSMILALPWVRKLEQGEFKVMSYVFLGLVTVCCILWIIADVVIIKEYKTIKYMSSVQATDEENRKFIKGLLGSLNYLKATLFITIQFSVASFIATSITKLRNSMIPFQAITYSAYGVCDFWISGILLSLRIKSNIDFSDDVAVSDIFSTNQGLLKFLVSRTVITILVIAIAYVIISAAIMKRQEAKRINNATEDLVYGDKKDAVLEQNTEAEPQKYVETPEEKLASLKKMLDNNLITNEEYDKKKSEILKDM